MRLIDADALKTVFTEKSSEKVCGIELCKAIINRIDQTPTVDAIPIEYIQKEIKDLEESLDFYGSIGEYDALRIDAMYQHDALTGLLRQWKADRKDNG